MLAIQSPELHPIFVLDKDAMLKSYDQGRKLAKDKVSQQALVRPWSKDVGKVRSPSGQSWTAPFAMFIPPVGAMRFMGYSHGREYVDRESGLADFERDMASPVKPEDRRIRFRAVLFSWPGISDLNHQINRHANEADVKDIKFVVLVDNERPIHPAVRPTLQGEAKFTGTERIPERHTIYGSSEGTATASSSGGTATVKSNTTSTVTYTTFTVEAFNVYQAVYDLEFPLYKPDGSPYVSKDTKELVLKVIRPSGEHSATFKLNDYLKK